MDGDVKVDLLAPGKVGEVPPRLEVAQLSTAGGDIRLATSGTGGLPVIVSVVLVVLIPGVVLVA